MLEASEAPRQLRALLREGGLQATFQPLFGLGGDRVGGGLEEPLTRKCSFWSDLYTVIGFHGIYVILMGFDGFWWDHFLKKMDLMIRDGENDDRYDRMMISWMVYG